MQIFAFFLSKKRYNVLFALPLKRKIHVFYSFYLAVSKYILILNFTWKELTLNTWIVCSCSFVCVCVCVYTHYLVSMQRENAFGLLFIIWSRSEEMHSARVNIDCVTQCATQQPDSSCLCRRDILEKVLEQFLHWYFFTSEWVCRWALRFDLSANALLQWGQEKGFSPGGGSGVGGERKTVSVFRGNVKTDNIYE